MIWLCERRHLLGADFNARPKTLAPEFEEAARSLGASQWQVTRRVTLPGVAEQGRLALLTKRRSLKPVPSLTTDLSELFERANLYAPDMLPLERIGGSNERSTLAAAALKT